MKNGCANRRQSQARLSYAEVKPVIDEVNEEWLREPKNFREFFCGQECPVIYRNFSEMFFLDYSWVIPDYS